jgi:hypothetical protein
MNKTTGALAPAAAVAVVGVGNEFDERADYILADGLVSLLDDKTVVKLQFSRDLIFHGVSGDDA